jgi:hypothetical protein
VPATDTTISPAYWNLSVPLAPTGVPKGLYVDTENVVLVAPCFQTWRVLPRGW